ncbi:hypothetical protein [Hoeflea poritis]|uniref:DUF1360 domain-containing protein n=1 Tax=Hoeflea poritis TaxID=2993659 RepID=A0ABT4VQG8_9HYPH|nr:hypothetical protein [Hoeflea poritis]MDA4846263.1 hypothetical protein [Hoeflea poritis]
MSFELALIGVSVHLLIWEKLPEWGTWFNALLARLPQPLQTLYEQWRCPYCAGFWIALVLHGMTGFWTISALAELPAYWGPAMPFVGWFLDALASAVLIQVGILIVGALRLPAMKSYMMKQDFMRSFKTQNADEGAA